MAATRVQSPPVVALALAAFLLLADVTTAAGLWGPGLGEKQVTSAQASRKLLDAPTPPPVVTDYFTQFCPDQGERLGLCWRNP